MTSSACNPREANKLKERLINDLHVLEAFGAIPLNACWADLYCSCHFGGSCLSSYQSDTPACTGDTYECTLVGKSY